MFGNTTEKRIVREADKIISLKEDVDALSWGRVLEIGKRLQDLESEGEAGDLAREVVTIAQSNLSLSRSSWASTPCLRTRAPWRPA